MPPATPSESFDTPSIPASEANFIAHSKTRIAAPASMVFRTLRNTETWRDWNPWVPKVVITYQTPDADVATAEEIAELVHNTSIAGSYDSDLTDGGGVSRRKSVDSDKAPDTPSLKLRSKSNASAFSGTGAARSNSEASEAQMAMAALSANPVSTNGSNIGSGEPKLSAAQKYAAAQESRRSSVSAGESLPAVSGNTLTQDPFLSPASFSTQSDPNNPNRRKSAAEKARQKQSYALLLRMYGEPSVRVQLNTKMSMFVRSNPHNKQEYKQQHIVVTHVSRPDDPAIDGFDDETTEKNDSDTNKVNALKRSQTHTLSDQPSDGSQPVYRIVWTIDSSKASLSTIKNASAYPKSLLAAERVHEIRPIMVTRGNGETVEECEYRMWECQKGPVAKLFASGSKKKKTAEYMQVMFERWGSGLAQFCEALGGNVDRRDFSVDLSAGVVGGVVGVPGVPGLGTAGLADVKEEELLLK